MELGTVPTPIRYTSFEDELARCQRYYQKSFAIGTAPAQNVGVVSGSYGFGAWRAGALLMQGGSMLFPSRMRAAPTVTLYNPSAANAQMRDVTAGVDCSSTLTAAASEVGMGVVTVGHASTAVGNQMAVHWTAAAEL